MRQTRVQNEIRRLDETNLELGALSTILTPDLLGEVLEAAGKTAKRLRKLPPDLVMWLVVAMSIFRGLSIQNVLARLADVFGSAVRWGPAELPHSTAITQARDRLGWEVVRTLFARLAAKLTQQHEPPLRWRGLVVCALDGTTLLVPDSKANDQAFGRPGTSRGEAKSGFPQLRAVFVLGVLTHLVTHVVFAPYSQSELKTAEELARDLEKGTLLLMDRLYYSFAWLAGLRSHKLDFVVRAKIGKRTLKPKTVRRLRDGTTRAKLLVPRALKTRQPELPDDIEVRVVKYRAKGFRPLTVVTTLLEPKEFPAAEIGALYHERWEIELGCRELKTHQTATRVAFRSKTPDRVRQEAYGLFLAYNCVRGMMAEAAALQGVAPRRLSFVDCLERIRAAVIASDGDDPDAYDRLLGRLGTCTLPPRRVGRRCPRAVKVKMSKWPRKRPGSQVVAVSRSRR